MMAKWRWLRRQENLFVNFLFDLVVVLFLFAIVMDVDCGAAPPPSLVLIVIFPLITSSPERWKNDFLQIPSG